MSFRKANKNRLLEIIDCACDCGEKLNKYDERNRARTSLPNHIVKMKGERKGRFVKGQIPHNFKGGIVNSSGGYLWNNLKSKLQHRVIMEEYLDRKLRTNEHTHHINGDKKDNRIDNLELINNKEHGKKHNYFANAEYSYNRWSKRFERRTIFQNI